MKNLKSGLDLHTSELVSSWTRAPYTDTSSGTQVEIICISVVISSWSWY